jgi:ATPase family associated with various cellular activities (AAA)
VAVVISAQLCVDLRMLDELLLAELAARPATPMTAAQWLGALVASHRDGVEHAPASAELFALAPAASPVIVEIERRFGLWPVDRLLLLLAVAPELDGRYAHAFGALSDVAGLGRPTVALAQALVRRRSQLDLAVVDRLLPTSPLGRYGLVTVDGAPGAVHRCLAASPEVLAWLTEPGDRGERGPATAPEALEALALSAAARAQLAGAARWIGRVPSWTLWVHGAPGSGRAAAARAIIGASGARSVITTPAAQLASRGPAAVARAAVWAGAVLLIDGAEPSDLPALRELAAAPAPLAVTSRTGALTALIGDLRPCLDLALPAPAVTERAVIWRAQLGAAAAAADPDELAARFRFGPERIGLVVRRAAARAEAEARPIDRAVLDDASRDLTLGRLADLGTRLDVRGASAALVLGPGPGRELALAGNWARHSRAALARTGPALIGMPEDHLVCLFHGPPGTGKTLGARALAEQLGLDIYRIDLSQLVSKWVGETEKNLAVLFDEADGANAVLFFDEADALFSRRTDVRDAHDKYANVEAGYLLQRVEEHRGVVVLATNYLRNLDAALMRRCQVIVEFSPPGVEQRREIWARCIGAGAAALDLDFLAGRFELAGGDIRNATMSAFLIAETRGTPLAMEDLIVGVWRELHKAGRITAREDFGPWGDVALRYAMAGRAPERP